MTRPQSAIAATGVRKSFGDHLVLDGVDLDVAWCVAIGLAGYLWAKRLFNRDPTP
ncbi:MAG TPA: hypothetical protein VK631_18880 [Solirubrobacteraceae bacterium]|nr:hypothetical protein [Solirubrobacteraceae bacterium]